MIWGQDLKGTAQFRIENKKEIEKERNKNMNKIWVEERMMNKERKLK